MEHAGPADSRGGLHPNDSSVLIYVDPPLENPSTECGEVPAEPAAVESVANVDADEEAFASTAGAVPANVSHVPVQLSGATGSEHAVVRVLGPVEVSWRQPPERRVVTELACFLAMHSHRSVTSEEARAALWPGDPESTDASAKSLRNAVSLLRKALGPESIPEASKGKGYRLSDVVTSDWSQFEQLVTEADKAVTTSEETRCLTQALALVRGAPFQGVDPGSFSWAWTELIVSRIEVAVVRASHRLCVLAIEGGNPEQASWAALQGLSCSPYEHRLWSDQLEACARIGRGGSRKSLETGDCRSRC